MSKKPVLDDEDWGPLPPEPRRHSGLAIASFVLASIASALLVFAVSHVRIDHKKTFIYEAIVTLVGPAVAWVEPMAIAGWMLTFIAGITATSALRQVFVLQKDRKIVFAILGLYLMAVNLFGTCLFLGMLED